MNLRLPLVAGAFLCLHPVREAQEVPAPPPSEAPACVSAEQAVALALNGLTSTEAGYRLQNPRHTGHFSHQGLRFEPRRGGPAWQWNLAHFGPQDGALEGVLLGPVAPLEEAGAVRYPRGDIVEQYLAKAETIEQQFVIRAALALDEDLIIEGRVQCPGEFEVTSKGWTWSTAEGSVSLGDVYVYDANGTELPAKMLVQSDRTRIVIEHAALARAAYPVTVDPEVGANDFRISDMGPNGNASFDATSPAVAYNPTNNEYLVVWNGDDNIAPLVESEEEVFGQRINAATGAEVGANDFRISSMGLDGDFRFNAVGRPAVAYNSANNQYLVVWLGNDGPPLANFELEIYGQRLNAVGGEIGVDFRISDMGPDGDIGFFAGAPAVAYNSTNNEYLVVWNGDDNVPPLVDNEEEIFGQRLNAVTGVQVGANDFRISDMGPDGSTLFGASASPAVAYNSTNNEYLVVWSGDDNIGPLVNDEEEIFGQRINAATGVQVGANDFRLSDMGPPGDPAFIAVLPTVAYNSLGNEYLVAWQGNDGIALQADPHGPGRGLGGETPLFIPEGRGSENASEFNPKVLGLGTELEGATEFEIYGQLVSATGVELGNDFRISDVGPSGDITFNAGRPAVAYNASSNVYLVTWDGDDDTPPLVNDEVEVFGQRIDAATGAELGVDFRLSDMGPNGNPNFDGTSPAVAYNSVNNEYLIVWSGDDGAPLADDEFEIYGQRFEPPGMTGGGLPCFAVERLRIELDEHKRIKVRGSVDAGPGFDPRLEDITFEFVDGTAGPTVSFFIPAGSFHLEEEGDGEFEFEFESRGVEVEFEPDEFEFEFEAEEVSGLDVLQGPNITIRLIASLSGTGFETVTTSRHDDDELRFRASLDPDCSRGMLVGSHDIGGGGGGNDPGRDPPHHGEGHGVSGGIDTFDPDGSAETPTPLLFEIFARGTPGHEIFRFEASPGQPGMPLTLYIVAINGEPHTSRLGTGFFKPTGLWGSEIIGTPPGLEGIELTLRAVTFDTPGAPLRVSEERYFPPR